MLVCRDAWLNRWEVLDGPGEFPFAIGGYYAFYFLRPDDLKFEVVYMPSLEAQNG